MEAKDTMLPGFEEEIDAFNFLCNKARAEGTDAPIINDLCKMIAEAQAEITWSIAFKAGYEQKCFETYELGYSNGKQAGMEEEAKGGHNSISYLEGYQDGLAQIRKEWGFQL